MGMGGIGASANGGGAAAASGGGVVDSVDAGSGIVVDSSDPANPVVGITTTGAGANKVLALDGEGFNPAWSDPPGGLPSGGNPGNILQKNSENDTVWAALQADTVSNTQVAGDAAIAGTKIAPDFGSQAVQTTGAAYAAMAVVQQYFCNSSVPSGEAHDPAGSGRSIAVTGSNHGGRITLTAGASAYPGDLFTLTYNPGGYGIAWPVLFPANAEAAALAPYISVLASGDTFTVKMASGGSLTDTVEYKWHYVMMT